MKKYLLFASALLSAALMVSCKGKNDPTNPSDSGNSTNPTGSTATEVHSESGMYVGITGFGESVKYYPSEEERYAKLSKDNKSRFISFIDKMTVSNGTALFYALDNNLSYLNKCSFPDDVVNVSIITFTDGLDQGSRGVAMAMGQNDDYIKNTNSYLAEIKKKLSSTTIPSASGAIKINAYAIGVRGGDIITDEEVNMFKNNLNSMASSDKNAFMATNMNEVNQKFKEIAESLYKENRSTTATIILPMPSENVKERFAFDQVTNGADSKCYIEGVYRNGALEEVKYQNCKSSSGTRVPQTIVGTKVQFSFEKFEVAEGYTFDPKKIINFKIEEGLSSWQKNSEFKPEEQPQLEVKQSSAVIMLNLDCSSSLIDTEKNIDVFKDVKASAKNFINLLVDSNTDPTPTPDPTDNNPHCWALTYTYSGTTITEYIWTTEANMEIGVAEMKKEAGVSNVSYERASANDEYSCEALNPQPTTTYYIKHSWGSGADADWAWKQMTEQSDGTFTYDGLWGGIGANINTSASDAGALWFSVSDIAGASSLSVGDGVKFTYNPSASTLSATKTSSGSSNMAKVRFQKQAAYIYVTKMAIDKEENGQYVSTVADYTFGEEEGTTSYYEIAAGTYYPSYYDGEKWYYTLASPYSYNFQAGKKYTYTCGDDGEYLVFSIILDGTSNSPARTVAQKRIRKADMRALMPMNK